MRLKKRFLVLVILLAVFALTSYYFLNSKPKTSKFTKAKLVFQSSKINEFEGVDDELLK